MAKEDEDLRALAADTLEVLSNNPDGLDASPLDTAVAAALQGDASELDDDVDSLLPEGATANVILENGVSEMTLVSNGAAPGSSVSAQRPFGPAWASAGLVTDLRVYPSSGEADMNVTSIPLWRSNPLPGARDDGVNVTFDNGFDVTLEDAGMGPATVVNGSIPNASSDGGDGWPTDGGTVAANVTYKGETLTGDAGIATSDLSVVSDAHDDARDGLANATLDASPAEATLGDTVTITWDLSTVESQVSSFTDSDADIEADVRVYRPVPTPSADILPPEEHVWTDEAVDGSADLEVGRGDVVGTWTVLARLNYTLDDGSTTINQSARLVDTFEVSRPDAVGDPTALYEVEVVTWYEGG